MVFETTLGISSVTKISELFLLLFRKEKYNAPANKNRIKNVDGEELLDLPLFQDTLTPEIEEGKLRCDYSLPAADSDLSNGASTCSLYCKATSEEIEEVKKLKIESKTDYSMRLLRWQEMLKKKTTIY